LITLLKRGLKGKIFILTTFCPIPVLKSNEIQLMT